MAGRIFISYRRADTRGFSVAIFNYLATQFGADEIFMDVDKIKPGRDFVKVLEDAVDACDVLIALIGPRWLTMKDEGGVRRLDNPEDFVRVEITRALAGGVHVIPVLVDGAPHLKSSDLPEDLKKMARLHGFSVGDFFHSDMKRLTPVVREYLAEAEARRKREAEEIKQSEHQKQLEMANLLGQAKEALEAEEWSRARQKAQAALRLSPKNIEANVIMARAEAGVEFAEERAAEEARRKKAEQIAKAQVEKEREEKDKQKKIAEFLTKAQNALDAKAWGDAEKFIEEVLLLDKGNESAKKIKLIIAEEEERIAKEWAKKKQVEKEAQEKQKEIAFLLSKAQIALEEKRWKDAKGFAQKVLAISKDSRNAQVVIRDAEIGENQEREAAEEDRRMEAEQKAKVQVKKEPLEKEEPKKKDVKLASVVNQPQLVQTRSKGNVNNKKSFMATLGSFIGFMTVVLLFCGLVKSVQLLVDFVSSMTAKETLFTELMQLEGHTSWITSVTWSPDGTQIASGSEDDTVRIWDTTSWEQVAVLEGHTDNVYSVTWSPDGTQIASGSSDGTVWIWDAASWEQVVVLEGHTSAVNSVAWSPNGSQLVSGSSDHTVRIWDSASWEQAAVLEHTSSVDSVACVAWSPDGTQIASQGKYSGLRIWDATSGEQVVELEEYTLSVYSVAWSLDSTQIASGGLDDMVWVWDVVNGEQVAVLEGHTADVYSVIWSPDGTQIASGSQDDTVRIWDAVSGEQVAVLEGHTANVYSVAWSPDGTKLASGGDDNTVRIWDVGSDEQAPTATDAFIGYVGTPTSKATLTSTVIITETQTPTLTFTPMPTLGIGSILTNEKDGASMAYIPAGEFEMGSNDGDVDETQIFPVSLDAFWMYQSEVTLGMYRKCVAAGVCGLSLCDYYPGFVDGDVPEIYPVVCVNWEQAQNYCENWAGGELPTEAQWEWAARGGEEGYDFPWGNDNLPSCEKSVVNGVNFGDCFDNQHPIPVNSFYPNGYGLYDMSGNVKEWIFDWYAEYYTFASLVENVNPTGPITGTLHVIRGGSWDSELSDLRVTNRSKEIAKDKAKGESFYDDLGFRCVVNP